MLFGGLEDYEGLLVLMSIILTIHCIDKYQWTGITINGLFMQILFSTYLLAGYCGLYLSIPKTLLLTAPGVVFLIPVILIPTGLLLFQLLFRKQVQIKGIATYLTGTFVIYFGMGIAYAIVGMSAIILMILAYVVLFGAGGLGNHRRYY